MTVVPTRRDAPLRFAMRADAVTVGLTGLAVAPFAEYTSRLGGTTLAQEYALCAFCVLYGLVVYPLAARPDPRRAGIGVIVANVVCTVVALAVVATGVLPLTRLGTAEMLAGAAYTTFFAGLQYRGLRLLSG